MSYEISMILVDFLQKYEYTNNNRKKEAVAPITSDGFLSCEMKDKRV